MLFMATFSCFLGEDISSLVYVNSFSCSGECVSGAGNCFFLSRSLLRCSLDPTNVCCAKSVFRLLISVALSSGPFDATPRQASVLRDEVESYDRMLI